MPYKKSDNLTFTRVKVPANHLEWLTVELNAPSQADLLAGLVHFATTPAGKAAVRASGLVPQRTVPTPPAGASFGVYLDPRAVKSATKRVELTSEELDALLADS